MPTVSVNADRPWSVTRPDDAAVPVSSEEVERFRTALQDVERKPPARLSDAWRKIRPLLGKAAKIGLAVVVVAVVGWQPIQRLLVFSSVEAVVNAQLITLRAPIDGHLRVTRSASPGDRFAPAEVIFALTDPRADRARLDELQRQRDRAETERLVAAARATAARSEFTAAELQLQGFVAGRKAQLDRRHEEYGAELRGAEATHAAAVRSLRRSETLLARNITSEALFDRAAENERVAEQAVEAARQRLAALDVERTALASGMIIGDSYNDVPRSAERLSDLRQRIAQYEAELRAYDLRIARLETEIRTEEARYALASAATIESPRATSVWEMLTADGEQVRRGQDLARLLDCATPVVTAAVGEAVFNRLHVGAPARFRLKDTSEELSGHVVQLTSLASAPSNFAIAPAFLLKEAYRATIAVPGLANDTHCPVGRTGRVIFDVDASSAAGHPAS